MGLFAFFAARGVPLSALAACSPAELGFLAGARALYYEETMALIAGTIAKLLPGGDTE